MFAFTPAQTSTLAIIVGSGVTVQAVTMHPNTGTITLATDWTGRETVAMVAQDGAVTLAFDDRVPTDEINANVAEDNARDAAVFAMTLDIGSRVILAPELAKEAHGSSDSAQRAQRATDGTAGTVRSGDRLGSVVVTWDDAADTDESVTDLRPAPVDAADAYFAAVAEIVHADMADGEDFTDAVAYGFSTVDPDDFTGCSVDASFGPTDSEIDRVRGALHSRYGARVELSRDFA